MTLPDVLRVVLDDPAGACVLCDFDGTISAIVDDPANAVALAGALEALARLAARVGGVAIISGRPAAWLAGRTQAIASAPVELHGLYGLERWSDGAVVTFAAAEPWRAVIEEIAADAPAALPPTVLVEPKGLSVALHYRDHPSDEPTVMRWAEEQVGLRGVGLLTGRSAVELRPPIERDKGHAATEILERRAPRTVVFLGDDTGDLPVAAAVREYARRTGATGVVICVDSEETPQQMRDVADICVAGPDAAVALLGDLAERAGGA